MKQDKHPPSVAATEAAAAPAPRVPRARLDQLLARVSCRGGVVEGTSTTFVHAFLDGEFHLATGRAACVSKSGGDATVGFAMAQAEAMAAARHKLWELEGYLLRMRLCEQAQRLAGHRRHPAAAAADALEEAESPPPPPPAAPPASP